MLDKTPAWLEWAAYQAAMCDVDMVKKIHAALGGGFTAQDTDTALADMGIGRRQ